MIAVTTAEMEKKMSIFLRNISSTPLMLRMISMFNCTSISTTIYEQLFFAKFLSAKINANRKNI